mgnify:CR=1 FL=1
MIESHKVRYKLAVAVPVAVPWPHLDSHGVRLTVFAFKKASSEGADTLSVSVSALFLV